MGRAARVRSVFVDTSVLFAGIRSLRGNAADLLIAGSTGRVGLLVSRYVLAEARRNLADKVGVGGELHLDALVEEGVLRLMSPELATVRRVELVVEPKDAPVVAGALGDGALGAGALGAGALGAGAILATYDRRHLLSQAAVIRQAFGLEVVTPEEIMSRLGAASGPLP